jgi:hypothetical protein
MRTGFAVSIAAALATGGIGLAVVYARDAKPAAEVRLVGEAKSCVNLRSIRSTNVVDNQTIDFKVDGGRTLRNVLPYSCPSLKMQDAFSYRTSQNQLCSVDIIRVVNNYGGHLSEGAACGLGKFQQIEVVKPAG